MKACMTVYVLIYVLILFPLAFMLVRASLDKRMERKIKTRRIALCAAGIVVLTALCAGLYTITIDRQSYLVAERVIVGLRGQAVPGQAVEELRAQDILAVDAVDGAVLAAIDAGSEFAIGAKTLESDGGNPIYKVRIDRLDDALLLLEIRETPAQATVVSIALLEGEDAQEHTGNDQFTKFG